MRAEDRRTQRLHGFSYTAGILVSFWAIVAVLLVLRAGGRQAGWGFQLQSPAFVVLMASLLFFMALSLAGQFDLGLSLTSKGDALTRKPGIPELLYRSAGHSGGNALYGASHGGGDRLSPWPSRRS